MQLSFTNLESVRFSDGEFPPNSPKINAVSNSNVCCQHGGVKGKTTLTDLPVNGEQIKPSPFFVVCFSHES